MNIELQGHGKIEVSHFPELEAVDENSIYKAYITGVNPGVTGSGPTRQAAIDDLRLKLVINGWKIADRDTAQDLSRDRWGCGSGDR